MQNLTEHFVELIRRTSTDLPADVEQALRDARQRESPALPPSAPWMPSWRTSI